MKVTFLFLLLSVFYVSALAQTATGMVNTGSSSNPVFTGVPFLNITPDARSGAMGDAGVALEPEVNATFWNPSRLAFLNDFSNKLSVSYSPWLRQVSSDANLAYLNYARKLDSRNAIGVSLRYFNLGNVNLYDQGENIQGTAKPNEFSLDAALARKFGVNFSLGLSLRYIHSSIYQGTINGLQSNAGNAVAADVSLYYHKPGMLFGKNSTFAFGTNISNIGTKISYVNSGQKYFLPTNLKVGIANTLDLDDYNQLTFAFDVNKLLVPTPPQRDAQGNIIAGRDDNRSVVSGIFGSFSDAPGGFNEELKEISFSPGVEYLYNKQFALRAGYFYENPTKGNRQYLTLGAGFKYSDFSLDLSYLAATQNNSPLANTLRFTLGYNFGTR